MGRLTVLARGLEVSGLLSRLPMGLLTRFLIGPLIGVLAPLVSASAVSGFRTRAIELIVQRRCPNFIEVLVVPKFYLGEYNKRCQN